MKPDALVMALYAAYLLCDPVEDHLAGVKDPPMTVRALWRVWRGVA